MQKVIKTILYFSAVLVLIIPSKVYAISMHCIVIGNAGDVTVTWDAAGTSGANFRCWYLYHSTNAAGPFTAVDSSFFYPDTIANHAAANAANNNAYYFAAFKSNSGGPDILSDTIRAIKLSVNNPSSGTADLSWNATHNPLIPTNNPYYYIIKEYPAGFFTLIDSVDARTAPVPMVYRDPINICGDTVKYRIEVEDLSGCKSISAEKGDLFHDNNLPAVPIIDSVSIDILGNVIVTWQVSSSGDTRAYIIFQMTPALSPVDTVLGHNSTILNTAISGTNGSQTFRALAVDSCNNFSAPGAVHSTIFLSANFILCTQSIDLSWTPYDFWGAPPLYEILVSINGSAETIVDTTSKTTYSDTNLVSGSSMCYRVRAREIGSTRSSTSNRKCIVPNFPPPPAFSYIRKVSVTSDNTISVTAYVDPAASISGYKLYRSNSSTGPWDEVSSSSIRNISTITLVDQVSPDRGPYYYFISTMDSCGRSVLSSQVSKSILLSGISNENYTNSLEWTDYASWPAGVSRYELYLKIGGVTNTIPITSLVMPPFEYLDSILDNYYSDGEFCYTIAAIEEQGNPNFFLDTALSNEVCLTHPPLIFIPNAFHPGGHLNDIFYVSNAFVSRENYSLDIFNRWGEHIFHTSDPLVGWNGSTNGVMAPEGVYIYQLKAKNSEQGDIEMVGGVTLIR